MSNDKAPTAAGDSSVSPLKPAAASSPAIDSPGSATKGNPALRMMGLPNIRLRLPSRNWLIFLTVSTSLTTAILYDRRQKQRATDKWCSAVRHVAVEPLAPNVSARKVTIYVASPPGDGSVRSARDYFHEYVKPVLVAGGMDWDVVEGRREGDVRGVLAERVRKWRRMKGEAVKGNSADGTGHLTKGGKAEEAERESLEADLVRMREQMGIKEWDGVAGDVVIGRHTWKEYVRGLHEGWLAPLESPVENSEPTDATTTIEPASQVSPAESTLQQKLSDDTSSAASPTSSPASEPMETTSQSSKPPQSKPPTPKPYPPDPYISPSNYSSITSLPSTVPSMLGPSAAIPFPHILGFLNTPVRLKRFLLRRRLADEVGREVAAVVLGRYEEYSRTSPGLSSFTADENSSSPSSSSAAAAISTDDESKRYKWQQARLLAHEEADWPSSLRKQRRKQEESKDDNSPTGDGNDAGAVSSIPKKESVWLDDVVVDDRIAGRMRKFVLGDERENNERAS